MRKQGEERSIIDYIVTSHECMETIKRWTIRYINQNSILWSQGYNNKYRLYQSYKYAKVKESDKKKRILEAPNNNTRKINNQNIREGRISGEL